MIWGDSGYTSSPNIEALLSKDDVTLHEILNDEDIIQECKSQNKKLIQFLIRPNIIEELVTIITTYPSEDIPEQIRFKDANVACEILTSDVMTLYNTLISEEQNLMKFYNFIKQDPPLNPLLTSFFSKTFSTLLSRKSEQNLFSYESVCHQILEFIKARDDFFDTLLKHICMPVITDLLYHILTQIKETDMRNNILDYLNEKKLIESIIKILGLPNETEKHNNIAQFLSEIIKTGRTLRQDERQEGASEATHPILETLESEETTKLILKTILNEKSSESSITAGIKIILTLFENPIVNEPASDAALQFLIDSEKIHHKTVVLGLINSIIPTIKQFHDILLDPLEKHDTADVTWITPPFGNTRLQVCCLFTVLVETENLDILNAICEVEYFNTLLKLFKEYSWNNFLHTQVKKCLAYAFQAFDQLENEQELTPSALQKHIIDKCKIVSKLLDCWEHNNTMESKEKGRRLGYMGHLIDILEQLVSSISISDQLRALVELSLNESELELWKNLTNSESGDLVKTLEIQQGFLANCNPNQPLDATFDASPSKEFLNEQFTVSYFNTIDSNLHDAIGDLTNLSLEDFESHQDLFEQTCKKSLNSLNSNLWDDETTDQNNLALNIKHRLKVWSNDLDVSDPTLGDSNIEFGTIIGDDPWKISDNDAMSLNFVNPWGSDLEPALALQQQQQPSSFCATESENWANFEANNFADFDTHFTDFEPIVNIENNTENNNLIENLDNSGSGVINTEISQNDEKQRINKITKNLVPGADGRLVLATTFIPYNKNSDDTTNINNTQNYRETESDNHRSTYELVENKNKIVPLSDSENELIIEKSEAATNGVIDEIISNGPKNNEILATGIITTLENDSDSENVSVRT